VLLRCVIHCLLARLQLLERFEWHADVLLRETVTTTAHTGLYAQCVLHCFIID
jgi:hypothetical protein